jgi:osmotically-inducible protein OsmY
VASPLPPDGAELRHRVDSAIKKNPHLSGHRVYCQAESGIVVLHGRVTTFFQKQMAQESLKRLEGVEKIINELEVEWLAGFGPRL